MDALLYDRNRKPRDEGVGDLPMFMAPPAPPSNGIATSDEAARSLTAEQLNDGHRRVANAVWLYQATGITDENIQRVAGLTGNAERPRRGELVAARWVEARRLDGTPLRTARQVEAAGKDVQTEPTKAKRPAILWFPGEALVRRMEAKANRNRVEAA